MMAPRGTGPPLLGRLLLRFQRLGERREEIEADLGELFRERAVERGRWYATFRHCADAVSLWIHLRRGLVLEAAPHDGRVRAGSTAGEPTASSGHSPFGPKRRRNLVDGLLTDLKFALRSLRGNPGFTLVAILTLAIGIGANTAVFSVADAVLFRPLPYEEPDRVVILHEKRPPPSQALVHPAANTFFDWQERNHVFTAMALLEMSWVNLTGGAEPKRVYAHRVTGTFFRILGVNATTGRTFLPEDNAPDAAPVVVISHALWQQAFRGDPDVVGQTVGVDDRPHTIVGIAPADFSFNSVLSGRTPDLWVAAPVTPALRADSQYDRLFLAVARLRAGVTLEQAQAEMEGIAAARAAEYRQANPNARVPNLGAAVTRVHGHSVSLARPFVLFSMVLAGLVLLIACINVANMLLARSVTRRREIALRSALGAGRRRVVRQLLTESALLAVVGGAGGILLAWPGVAAVLRWGTHPDGGRYLGSAVPLLSRAGIDARALAATTMMCALTVALFGLAPALRATGKDPLRGLRAGASSTGWRRRFFDGDVFVAVEVALALGLLIGVGLLGTTFARLYGIPIGFRAAGVQVMAVELPRARYLAESGAVGTARATWAVRPMHSRRVRDIVQRVERLPGVDGAAAINIVPFGVGPFAATIHTAWVHVYGRAANEYVVAGVPVTQDASGELHFATVRMVTPGYFEAMGIPLLDGRDLSWSDDRGAPSVVIVDRGLAEWYWPGEIAVGKRVQVRVGSEWLSVEVVGVVGTVWQHGFYPDAMRMEQRIPGRMYFPYAQPALEYDSRRVDTLTAVNVVVRHRGDKQAVATSMADIVRALDPEVPIVRLESMEAAVVRSLADRRFHLVVIGSFSWVALVLALIGVYGMMAFQVSQRVREIGIRMSLGARATGVVRMIVVDGLRVAVLGALMGVAVAMAATRLLSNWLYGIRPTDPVVFVGLAGAMVGAAVLACWIPARRAARVDPIASLRAE